ncbi:hypothetical protein JWG39_06755 [Desulforhopalus vacuolatus]|uniref:hypothetical protein n=1 Tax=Desulforhopalus vacuolatus TaxID=40414 RepID=UPI001965116A|nr:hypothetical protein [Desulforhopalus vacuolatus]MBM9519519.1 hypothetical protein [Desulforhopalus vacuolatus]
MQCKRLLNLTKKWYLSVKDETMAPARMITFMVLHSESCPVCQQDPDLKDEIIKITEMILPESKIPKAVRQQQQEEEAAEEEENASATENEEQKTSDDDSDEKEIFLDDDEDED